MDEATRHRWQRVREEFVALFDLDAGARARRLDEIRRDDALMAADLEELLSGAPMAEDDEAAGSALEQPAGTIISERFRLLRPLGVGGMGEVHLAERTDELDRKVALKLVRSDLPIPVTRARREQHILARLTHPNIAGLVDAGLTASGQPWFAMEYVDGERITDWCARNTVDIDGRVRLVSRLARAVQHAHRNLILHRDIKPSNVLVDAEGEPKLLDFGIAKLLDGTDSQQTRTLAFTPAYAAPEQLRGERPTTASDIYQLGLILYELLVGVAGRIARESTSTGHKSASLPRLDQMFATIATKDGDRAALIARERSCAPERLRRVLKGDLARIVAKATADDLRERYDTAQALADDLDRWIDGLPVSAHRGSFAYRARKLVRRHRIAAAIIGVLAVGLVATSVTAVMRARAEHAQRQQAEAAEQRAQGQRKRAETLLGFMNDVFRQADPQNAGDAKLTPDQMLERAAATLRGRTDLDAPTRAALMTQVADTFNSLFLPERAFASARQALDALDPTRFEHPNDYLSAVIVALDALQMQGRSDEQLALIDEAMPVARQQAGREDDEAWVAGLLKFRGSARCQKGDYRGCLGDLREAVAGTVDAGEASVSAQLVSLNELAVLLSDEGNANESANLLDRASALAGRSPKVLKADVSTVRHNLATAKLSQGRLAEATRMLESSLAEAPALFGQDAGFIASIVRRSLARGYAMAGHYPRAEDTIRGVLAGFGEIGHPLDSPYMVRHVVASRLAAAKIALDLGNASSAEQDVLAARKTIPDGMRGMEFQRVRIDLLQAELLLRIGRCAEARPMFAQVDDDLVALIGGEPSWIKGEVGDGLGRCLLASGDAGAAVRSFDDAIAKLTASTGDTSLSTLRSRLHRAWADAIRKDGATAGAAIETIRAELVEALGSEDVLPIWQLDGLVSALAARFSWEVAGLAPRLDRASAGLARLHAVPAESPWAGLNSFN